MLLKLLDIYIYNFVVIKGMNHYDYNQQLWPKNMINGLCNDYVCTIVMVVINVL